jgi:hypothetical protein
MIKSCASCGADLTRWIRKPSAPPVIQATAPADATTSENAEAEPQITTNSMGKGILGALAGAALGAALMYGFFLLLGFRFPFTGVVTGLLTGYFAKKMYYAEDEMLGVISGAIAAATVLGTLYLMYHEFPILNIASVAVSGFVAYRTASD